MYIDNSSFKKNVNLLLTEGNFLKNRRQKHQKARKDKKGRGKETNAKNFRKKLEGKTIFDNLSIPLEILGLSKAEIVKRVQGVLNTVSLRGRMEERVSSLSAGEQQKVAIARAIINNPSNIIADEPTGSLDSTSANKIMEILRAVNSRGITVVCATHNLSLIKDERVIVMNKGRILV